MLNRHVRLDRLAIKDMLPGHKVNRPDQAGPIIFASPHSGSIYAEAFTARVALPLFQLRQSEDAFVDRLIAEAPQYGICTLKAEFPRSFVDVNRGEDEVSPDWPKRGDNPTARSDAGLGVIPTAVAQNVPIYSTALDPAVRTGRIVKLYRPYHNTLRTLLQEAWSQHGHALLVDMHSMPGNGPMNKPRSDFVLGDRFGQSCHGDTIDLVQRYLEGLGYTVTRNHPYAGGFITQHYGKPDLGCEALQIEINRNLYMNSATLSLTSGFETLQRDIGGLAKILSDEWSGLRTLPIAAE